MLVPWKMGFSTRLSSDISKYCRSPSFDESIIRLHCVVYRSFCLLFPSTIIMVVFVALVYVCLSRRLVSLGWNQH